MKTLSILLAAWIMTGSTYAQFQHAIGTDSIEVGRSVSPTFVDKGYITGGNTNFPILGDYDATLIKTMPDGLISWSAVYGKGKYEIFNSIREVPFTGSPNIKPGYAALGTTRSFGFGADDMYFVRTDLSGTPIFSKVFGRLKNDRGYCLQYIKDSSIGYGYVMVGETNSYPFFGGTTDVYVVKTDEFGNLVKATVIGGAGNESGYWIEQTLDQGYIIVGTTNRPCGSTIINQDIFVIRLDANLGLLWNAIIGGGTSTHADIAYSVVENPVDKSFMITGVTRSFGVNFNGDAFLLNLKSNGAFNWMKTYGRKKAEVGNSIHLTFNPFTGAVEYVVGGYSTSYNSVGLRDAYVFKTDASGNLLWTTLYGRKGREVVAEITDSGEKGYVFAGEVSDSWTKPNDIYLVKTDLNGKTGTCDTLVNQTVKVNSVCYTSSAQQVYVFENLHVESLFKHIDYKVNKCDPAAFSVLDDKRANEPLQLAINSQNNLTVQTQQKDYEGSLVRIYSMQGRLVAQKNISGDATEIQLEQAPAGLYIVHIIRTDGTVIRRKFMKN